MTITKWILSQRKRHGSTVALICLQLVYVTEKQTELCEFINPDALMLV